MSPSTTPSARSTSRIGRCVAAAGVLALVAVGCGSDDESASAEDQFCAAGESLQEDVSGLASVDLVSGGLDALNEQFEAVQTDVSDLRDAGADVAEAELTELDDSLDALSDSIEALGDDISAANATSVATAIADVASAATGVVSALADTCP